MSLVLAKLRGAVPISLGLVLFVQYACKHTHKQTYANSSDSAAQVFYQAFSALCGYIHAHAYIHACTYQTAKMQLKYISNIPHRCSLLHVCVYTYIHTYIYRHTYIHTYIHTYKCVQHVCTHTGAGSR